MSCLLILPGAACRHLRSNQARAASEEQLEESLTSTKTTPQSMPPGIPPPPREQSSVMEKTVLVTGGAGYIGSHCIVELLDAGYRVVAVDNFANSVGEQDQSVALKRVEVITGKPVEFYRLDLLDRDALVEVFGKVTARGKISTCKPINIPVFSQHHVDCVIHFAAMKAVGESMEYPLMYYKNNLIGMLNLLEVSLTCNGF